MLRQTSTLLAFTTIEAPTDGTLTKWKKEIGSKLISRDVLAYIDSQVVLVPTRSRYRYLARILVPEGTRVGAREKICVACDTRSELRSYLRPRKAKSPSPGRIAHSVAEGVSGTVSIAPIETVPTSVPPGWSLVPDSYLAAHKHAMETWMRKHPLVPAESTLLDIAVKVRGLESPNMPNIIASTDSVSKLSGRHVAVGAYDLSVVDTVRAICDSDKVAVLRGESGCGKTILSLLAAGPGNIAIYMTSADFDCETKSNSRARNEDFMNAVTGFVHARIADSKKNIGRKTDSLVTLVLDEMGSRADMVRAACSTRTSIRDVLGQYTTGRVAIIATGTGVASAATGSESDTYDQIGVAGRVWQVLLESLPRPNRLRDTLLDETGLNFPPKLPSAAMIHTAAGNARLAALVIQTYLGRSEIHRQRKGLLTEEELWWLFVTAAEKFKTLNGLTNASVEAAGQAFARAFHLCLTQFAGDLTAQDRLLVEKLGVLTDKAVAVSQASDSTTHVFVPCREVKTLYLRLERNKPRYDMSPAMATLGLSVLGRLSPGTWWGFETLIADLFAIGVPAFTEDPAADSTSSEPNGWRAAFAGDAGVPTDDAKRFPAARTAADALPRAEQHFADISTTEGWFTGKLSAVFRSIARRIPKGDVTEVLCLSAQCHVTAQRVEAFYDDDWKATDDYVARTFAPLRDQIHAALRDKQLVVLVNGPKAPGPDVLLLSARQYVGIQTKMCAASRLTASTVAEELEKMQLGKETLDRVSQVRLVITAGEKPEDVSHLMQQSNDCLCVYVGPNTATAIKRCSPFCVPVSGGVITRLERRYVGAYVTLDPVDFQPRTP